MANDLESVALMLIETRRIADLTPDPENARKHSNANIQAIAHSLDKFGQRRPIVVTHDGVILAGNGTAEAAKYLGWTEIAVTAVPETWSYEMARAYALADNRTAEMAEWDANILANQLIELDASGWEVGELGFENLEPPTDPEPLPVLEPRTHTCQACGEVIPCN